jgi:hypothetical protein
MMTATCSICREILKGKPAPLGYVAPDEFEWREVCLEAQRHFVARHAAEFGVLQVITQIWVHYLLSLQLLFTDPRAVGLQDALFAQLSAALQVPTRVQVIDVIPADAGAIDSTTLLPKDKAA